MITTGKPYSSELQMLKGTYQWALNEPLDALDSFIESSYNLPLLAVGSGGSLTAACMAALLHEITGMISKSITPLELLSSNISLNKTSILLLTAGGRNSDILTSFKYAASSEPRQLMTICTRSGSPLEILANGYKYVRSLRVDIPSGKDGFLATNSLIALTTILCRAYQDIGSSTFTLPLNLISENITEYDSDNLISKLKRRVWFVLYGGWGLPAAIDIESKFTEAALGNIQLSDYRNFAHGRHNWLTQRGGDTGMICLISPNEEEIANQTIKLIPEEIPIIKISTSYTGPTGALELLAKVLYFIKAAGDAANIDPGRPKVAEFGRRIYHLNIRSIYAKNESLKGRKKDEFIAIKRKNPYILEANGEEFTIWKSAYLRFIGKLKSAYFGAVVFDYDGTLSDPSERFSGPSEEIKEKLTDLLEGNVLVGIATGRGKSVREEMQKYIPPESWDKVLIGYYNGSNIDLLSNDLTPQRDALCNPMLKEIADNIKNDELLSTTIAECELRSKQLTIIPKKLYMHKRIKEMIISLLPQRITSQIKILESSHSMDIILSDVSKVNLVHAIESFAEKSGRPKKALCIGDKGEWPGNDYELLCSPFSLSVDYVSSDLNSCWNLSPAGHRGAQATLDYIRSFIIDKNYFQFDTSHIGGKE